MFRLSRMLAVLQLAVFMAAVPGLHAFPSYFDGAAGSDPAMACHSHGPAMPSQRPVSYQCCVSGHQVALPGVSFSAAQPAMEVLALSDRDITLVGWYHHGLTADVIRSDSPPGIIPLRI
jgi:hypothetical protein